MYKIVLLVCTLLLVPVCHGETTCAPWLDHSLKRLHDPNTLSLCEATRGKPVLLVNTASHCGYTKQFKGLEALNQKYRDRGLAVVGFASNDFRQEAKDEEKVAKTQLAQLVPSASDGALYPRYSRRAVGGTSSCSGA